jgi:hypothetical protein
VRVLANELRLVYPPISNQEGQWLSAVPAFREQVARSKLYMIAQRAALAFGDIEADQERNVISFTLSHPEHEDAIQWDAPLSALIGEHEGEVDFEAGEKIIRILDADDPGKEEPLAWFTPDKLLFDASHGLFRTAHGYATPDYMVTYDLLYVGISKVGDSISRLFETGHEARTKILTNQHQRVPTARVSDEMMLFLFDVDRIGIRQIDEEELRRHAVGEDWRAEPVAVIADAEKAFIKLLDPEYNTTKYRSYPKGADGLYDAGLTRYAFAIREDLVLRTTTATIHGSVAENGYDVLLIDGDNLEVHYAAGVSDID